MTGSHFSHPPCIALHVEVSGLFRYISISGNSCYLGCLYLFLIFDRFRLYSVFKVLPLHHLMQVGLSGLEPPTSRLSGVRSNRLSYKPLMETERFELLTPCLQGRCSPN